MEELIIEQADWEDCVAKWVEVALHPKTADINHICGLCNAIGRAGFNRRDFVGCKPCPAYPHICGVWEGNSLFSKIWDSEQNWRIVRSGALEILEWLQELGELAGWTKLCPKCGEKMANIHTVRDTHADYSTGVPVEKIVPGKVCGRECVACGWTERV